MPETCGLFPGATLGLLCVGHVSPSAVSAAITSLSSTFPSKRPFATSSARCSAALPHVPIDVRRHYHFTLLGQVWERGRTELLASG